MHLLGSQTLAVFTIAFKPLVDQSKDVNILIYFVILSIYNYRWYHYSYKFT